ncbi:LuxR C-terminal-related transcriptional regulator [Nocardioides renjunii]|uniref:LuxR C-terminal-related transcriptional regulator n=1 Tax=Nocardioides renjunii TaxID=3095075 RepID=UPI002AFFFBF8|nr:LuxR C-terminal-related transcriptional regulator [Nocardioides sp. S-34]WQQ20344.1 LuxR C-terminal-related transcriptional regulator [Nocardioides sp. S-34]
METGGQVVLEELGIAPDVERVYRALLGRPHTTAAVLAGALDRSRHEVGRGLATLVELGLAIRSDDATFVAAPPAIALGALLNERRDGLRLVEQALATMAEEHRAAMTGRDIGELIEVVTGVDAVRHRFHQVQQAASRELRMFVTAPFVAVPPGENRAEAAAVDRGVAIRVVLDTAVLAEPGAVEEAEDSLRNGLQVRVVDVLPIKLVIADAELALVPLGLGGGPGAVLLQRSGLLAALDALFESTWRHAYPLVLPDHADDPDGAPLGPDRPEAGPTALDRQVLSLMLAGVSDQAVASQLGLSLRTVQRRLRHLQDLAGVRSRIQLGWYAARHGWA